MKVDHREHYQEYEWQQGELLTTSGWEPVSTTAWDQSSYDERCKIYMNFSREDRGWSRQLVCICASPKECLKEVKFHNNNIKMIRLLMPKTPQIIGFDPSDVLNSQYSWAGL